MGVKLGNLDVSFKLGSADVSAAYLGSVLVYSGQSSSIGYISYSSNGSVLASGDCNSLSNGVVNRSVITDGGNISISSIYAVEIGACVTEISASTFASAGDVKVSAVTFEQGSQLATIGERAFKDAKGFTTPIELPNSVTTLGNYAFSYADNMAGVFTIPSGVTHIGTYCFEGLSRITSFVIEATTPPTIGNTPFTGTTCPIYVPAASVDTYKAASGWSSYASRIQAIPTPSPQWVTFNGDDISGLQVYGVKGTAADLSDTFSYMLENIYFELSRNIVSAQIGGPDNPCYTNDYGVNDNVEIIFSNVGCSDYYTLPSMIANSTVQLYIYQ